MPYNPLMTRKIGIERAINSILRMLVFATTAIIAVAVLAVLFDFDDLMPNKLTNASSPTGRVSASYQGEIGWTILRGQDRKNIRFKFIEDAEDSYYSVWL